MAGLSAAACTSTSPRDPKSKTAAPVTSQHETGTAAAAAVLRDPLEDKLLVVAEWSSMMSGSSVAVYADGLIDRRWTELVEERPRWRYEDKYRVAMAKPDDIFGLKRDLQASGFLDAEPSYHEDGVLDGGAITISDGASARRVIVVNEPKKLPGELRRLSKQLYAFARFAERVGEDPFDTKLPSGRMSLVHEFKTASEQVYVFTVFESGVLELRLIYDPDQAAHNAPDHPTPRSVVVQVDPRQLEPLSRALEGLRAKTLTAEELRGAPDEPTERLWLRGPNREITAPVGSKAPPLVQRVLEESQALRSEMPMP